MEVEIFFGSLRLGICGGETGEGGGCWYHQEGEGLGACWGEGLFFSIFDVVGVYAIDGIKQLGVLPTC